MTDCVLICLIMRQVSKGMAIGRRKPERAGCITPSQLDLRLHLDSCQGAHRKGSKYLSNILLAIFALRVLRLSYYVQKPHSMIRDKLYTTVSCFYLITKFLVTLFVVTTLTQTIRVKTILHTNFHRAPTFVLTTALTKHLGKM